MEEEGTVVYFETSPSAQEIKTGTDDIGEELTFTTQHHYHETLCDKSKHSENSRRWTFWGIFQQLVAGVWVSKWTMPEEANVLSPLVTQIKNSPLLTEEDCHVLHISLTHEALDGGVSCNSTTDKDRSRLIVYSVSLSLLVAMVAISLSLGRDYFIAVCILTSLVASLWSLKFLLCRYYQKRLDSASRNLTNYSQKFEKLLSLLTQALRTIQEIEIISRGYSRPSMSVPISRLEGRGNTLQCVALRHRVFQVCQTGVSLLRMITKKLCSTHSLNEELDSLHCYLSFRLLSDLHQYMREEEGEVLMARNELSSEYEDDTLERLSLESMKDACNLFAVQNSEFLRRLALLIGFKPPGSSTNLTNRARADILLDSLNEPLQFVSKALEQLDWSLQYQKNSFYGEPPTRAVIKNELKSDHTHHSDIQLLVEEVHCLDLQLQVALQSVREVGTMLAKQDCSGAKPVVDEVLQLSEHLLNIRANVERCSEHISTGVMTLDHMLSPTPAELTDDRQEAGNPTVDSDTEMNDEEHDRYDQSDEDDLVFEAYIPPQDSTLEEEWTEVRQLSEAEREKIKEAKEIPQHLLKELNSVLTVRNEVREKRRQERKKTRSSKLSPKVGTNTTAKPSANEECGVVSLEHSTENTITAVNLTEHKLPHMSDTEETVLKGDSPNPRIKIQTVDKAEETTIKKDVFDLDQRSLAQAVAAAALKTKRQQNTEVFYDDSSD